MHAKTMYHTHSKPVPFLRERPPRFLSDATTRAAAKNKTQKVGLDQASRSRL
jgi:hypothetical protein